jgi:hypothetical protein
MRKDGPNKRESPLSAYVDPEIKERVTRVAVGQKRSVSNLIEECLKKALPKMERGK